MGGKRKLEQIECQDIKDEEKSTRVKRAKVVEDEQSDISSQPQSKTRKSTQSKSKKIKTKVEVCAEYASDVGSPNISSKVTKKKTRAQSKSQSIKSDKEAKDEKELEPVKNEEISVDTKTSVKKKSSKRKAQSKVENIKGITKGDEEHELKSEINTDANPDAISRSEQIDSSKKYVGAHVSISGGMFNAVKDAVEIGAKSFAMFLRSQRQWNSKPLDDSTAEKFKECCKTYDFSPHVILPHGIYLMNCGSPDEEILKKSRDVLVDELKRCEKLGLCMYNFHPGSTCGKIPVSDCLQRIAESINMAHAKTKYVVTVLENMSCQGHTIGGKFEELHGIIEQVVDKSRVGVCLDTCHAFAAGFDISNEAGYMKMMQDFDKIIGLKFLKAVHLNDSKGELGCHLDRHENIGKGKIGKEGFNLLMNDLRFNGIPLILETPCENDNTYRKEIKLLYSMMK